MNGSDLIEVLELDLREERARADRLSAALAAALAAAKARADIVDAKVTNERRDYVAGIIDGMKPEADRLAGFTPPAAECARADAPGEAETLAERLRDLAAQVAGDYGYNIASVLNEAADLIDRMPAALAAERARADEAAERVEELELDAGRVSREFEGDLWRALRSVVADNPDINWRDYPDGMQPGEVAQIFSEDMAEAWAQTERATGALAAERARADRLEVALTDISVYGCGMINPPAARNGSKVEWLRKRIREYERVARDALANTQTTWGGDD